MMQLENILLLKKRLKQIMMKILKGQKIILDKKLKTRSISNNYFLKEIHLLNHFKNTKKNILILNILRMRRQHMKTSLQVDPPPHTKGRVPGFPAP